MRGSYQFTSVANILPLTSSLMLLPPSSISRRNYQLNHNYHRSAIKASADKYVLEWKVILDDTSNVESNNGVFNAASFSASKAWGRRPLLLRNAFNPEELMALDDDADVDESNNNDDDDVAAWPSWQDVVDIASDDDAESRVISHIPGDYSTFEIEWGTLSNADINKWISKERTLDAINNGHANTERKETLVVNDIDRFYPPLADWIHDKFSFIPNWRMDDGQISLAEVDGGIGPHVDNYDVFLIQMNGSRTWQVGKRKIDSKEERDRLIEDIDVRVLSDWNHDQETSGVEEFVLKPGDCLYLPPRVPHCGIALSDGCMTLSVGCRAPSVSDLVSKLAEHFSSSVEDVAVRRYTDDELLDNLSSDELLLSPGEITVKAKEDTKLLILNALTTMMDDDAVWDEFFGRYITEPKRLRSNYPIPLEEDFDAPTLQDVLDGNGALYHAEGICFSHSVVNAHESDGSSTNEYRLFVNGKMWQSDSVDDSILYQTISNNRVLDGPALLESIGDDEKSSMKVEFLEELVMIGVLYTQ